MYGRRAGGWQRAGALLEQQPALRALLERHHLREWPHLDRYFLVVKAIDPYRSTLPLDPHLGKRRQLERLALAARGLGALEAEPHEELVEADGARVVAVDLEEGGVVRTIHDDDASLLREDLLIRHTVISTTWR